MDSVNLKQINSISEISELSILARKIWKEHFTPIIGKMQVEYMLKKFQSESALKSQIEAGYQYFFLRKNGKYIGYTAIKPETNYLYLSKFYIEKSCRGNGYSHKMIEFIETECQKSGLSSIRLNVNKYNDNTIAVYKKLGFSIIREEKNDIDSGFFMDDYVMEKIL